MSESRALKDEELSIVSGGVNSDDNHIYSVDDYVVYTFREALYCYHISGLYTAKEQYKANLAVKTSKSVTYDVDVLFDGRPKSVEKTKYTACPEWCTDIR